MTKLFARTVHDMSTTLRAATATTTNGTSTVATRNLPKQLCQDAPNESFAKFEIQAAHVDNQPNDKPNDELVKINQLIDLSDEPIGLTRDEICWSRVRASASNCICCCCNNTITLITTDESYVLDYIPLDNIDTCQANSSLQYLALANKERLAVIDLIESSVPNERITEATPQLRPSSTTNQPTKHSTKLVDFVSAGLSMEDIVHWRWIDVSVLAFVSRDALYTCSVDHLFINHPAMTALGSRATTQLLPLKRVCDIYYDLGSLSQITDIRRDASTNLYAITGLSQRRGLHHPPQPPANSSNSSKFGRFRFTKQAGGLQDSNNATANINNNNNNNNKLLSPNSASFLKYSASLRPNSISVPSRLSMLADDGQASTGCIKSENLFSGESFSRATRIAHKSKHDCLTGCQLEDSRSLARAVEHRDDDLDGVILGNTQIYCKLRDCSQLIQAHAIAFATVSEQVGASSAIGVHVDSCNNRRTQDLNNNTRTTLVTANLAGDKLTVHFIGMATSSDLSISGQSTSRCLEFKAQVGLGGSMNFPSSITCSKLKKDDEMSHAAMIVTKFGHLIVCSITQSTILFHVQISRDIVCGVTLEDKTQGAMVVFRSGQVLLIRLDAGAFRRLLNEAKTSRYSVSSFPIRDSADAHIGNNHVNLASGGNSRLETYNNSSHSGGAEHPSDGRETKPYLNDNIGIDIDIDTEVIISTKL